MTLNYDRMGTFTLPFEFIEDCEPDYWAELMGSLIIVDVEMDINTQRVVYTAISEKFSEIAENLQVPQYIPIWNREEGRVVFHRV